MHSTAIEEYKKTLQLTDFQREIVVGTLLGDGHLETRDGGKTYRLKIEHSIKQKEYVDWLYGVFRLWVRGEPYLRQKKGGVCYGFTTYAHPAFRFYGQQFYGHDGIKRVPEFISKLLTPTSIAIWYLDDGSVKSNRHKTFIIHSHGYSKKDLARIQRAFLRFKIETRLHKQNRESGIHWRIYVVSGTASIFKKIIEPMILCIPSMRYKLGNNLPKE